MGEGREMLFNRGQIRVFVPLKGQNLRRARVCFLCREMTRDKLEDNEIFHFPQTCKILLKTERF